MSQYIAIDIETSGRPDPKAKTWEYTDNQYFNNSRLIELGYITVNLDTHQEIEGTNIMVKYDGPIHPEAVAKHGITEEIAKQGTELTKEMINKFYNQLGRSKYVIGYNVNFDIEILANEMHRRGYAHVAKKLIYMPRICLLNITYKSWNKLGLEQDAHHRLSDIYEKLFQEQYQAHRTIEDCRATIRIFKEYNVKGYISDTDIYKLGATLRKSTNGYKTSNNVFTPRESTNMVQSSIESKSESSVVQESIYGSNDYQSEHELILLDSHKLPDYNGTTYKELKDKVNKKNPPKCYWCVTKFKSYLSGITLNADSND
ncbi:MAG: 3'-5' exonuclease, partial [Candidatus Paceibacterota bacterium]